MKAETTDKIISKIAYVIMMDKLKNLAGLNVSFDQNSFFTSNLNPTRESYIGFVFKNIGIDDVFEDSQILIEKLLNLNLIKKSDKAFWVDDEDEECEVEIEILNNSEKNFYINGHKADIEESEIIYYYSIHPSIFEEAKSLYNDIIAYIEKEENSFTFIEKNTKYQVPLFYIDLLIALDDIKIGSNNVIEKIKEMQVSNEDCENKLMKIKNVDHLIDLSTKEKTVAHYSWKDTLDFQC